MTNERDTLNAVEAARFLRVHVETFRRLARRRDIPAFKVGKDWRIRPEILQRWIDEHGTISTTFQTGIQDEHQKQIAVNAQADMKRD